MCRRFLGGLSDLCAHDIQVSTTKGAVSLSSLKCIVAWYFSVCCYHVFFSNVELHAACYNELKLNELPFMIVFFCDTGLKYSSKFFPFLFLEEFTCLETVNTRLCSFHSAKSTAAANNASNNCTYSGDAKPFSSARSREGNCNCNKYSTTTCNQPNSAYTSWC